LICKDFATQEEAQKHWDEHGSTADNDPERLDKDGDGIPCKDEGSGGNSASNNSGSESDNYGSGI